MSSSIPNPLALIAELTHRCPLHCVYCSNPLELTGRNDELSTDRWVRVLKEAGEMGILQADFTGGEPLARPDLVVLVNAARASGLYVSLISSGLPLDEKRLDELVAAGVDHFQLSFQGAHEESASRFSGTQTHVRKLCVARWIAERRIALTLNFVIHRGNVDELPGMVELAESLGAGRVEFAHVQYYGWALRNRAKLLPTREQLNRSLEIIRQADKRLRGRMRVEYVVPDYYARYPKACMGGWGRKALLIKPDGSVLPCHAANVLPGITFANVQRKSLRDIWEHSEAFQKFRGEEWMPELCRTCDRRLQDFGGCRCQAFLLAGDAGATDPVCSKSTQRPVIDQILAEANSSAPVQAESSSRVSPISPSSEEWVYRSQAG